MRFFRGLVFGVPIGLALWILLITLAAWMWPSGSSGEEVRDSVRITIIVEPPCDKVVMGGETVYICEPGIEVKGLPVIYKELSGFDSEEEPEKVTIDGEEVYLCGPGVECNGLIVMFEGSEMVDWDE